MTPDVVVFRNGTVLTLKRLPYLHEDRRLEDDVNPSTPDNGSVDTVTLDDLTEREIATLTGRLLQAAEIADRPGVIINGEPGVHRAAILRGQVEFWLSGRAQTIPPAWQGMALEIIGERNESKG